MAKESCPSLRVALSRLYFQERLEEEPRRESNSTTGQESELAPRSPEDLEERVPFLRGEEVILITQRRSDAFAADCVSQDRLQEGTLAPISKTGSVLSNLSLQSVIRCPNTVHLSRGFGSQSVVLRSDNAHSSDTLTFPPQSVETVWDDSNDEKRLSTVHSIPHSLHLPSDVSMGEPRTIHTEITEASSNNEQDSNPLESELSITTIVPTPPAATKPDSGPTTTPKKRRFWTNWREGSRFLVLFSKRLCPCLSPEAHTPLESTQYPIYELNTLEVEDGVVKSRITLDSSTTRKIEKVVDESGGLIILAGSKLDNYQHRLESMMNSVFDRAVGFSLLETWRTERPEQTLELLESVQEFKSFENRVLTLADIDLTQIKRTTKTDDRENTFNRYFSSYQGLSQQMLVP